MLHMKEMDVWLICRCRCPIKVSFPREFCGICFHPHGNPATQVCVPTEILQDPHDSISMLVSKGQRPVVADHCSQQSKIYPQRGPLRKKYVGPFTSKKPFCAHYSRYSLRSHPLFRYFRHAKNLPLLLWGPCSAEYAEHAYICHWLPAEQGGLFSAFLCVCFLPWAVCVCCICRFDLVVCAYSSSGCYEIGCQVMACKHSSVRCVERDVNLCSVTAHCRAAIDAKNAWNWMRCPTFTSPSLHLLTT